MYDFGQQFSNSFMNMYQFNQQRKLDKERMDMERQRVGFEEKRLGLDEKTTNSNLLTEEQKRKALQQEMDIVTAREAFMNDPNNYVGVDVGDKHMTGRPDVMNLYTPFGNVPSFIVGVDGSITNTTVPNWKNQAFFNNASLMESIYNKKEDRKVQQTANAISARNQEENLRLAREREQREVENQNLLRFQQAQSVLNTAFNSGEFNSILDYATALAPSKVDPGMTKAEAQKRKQAAYDTANNNLKIKIQSLSEQSGVPFIQLYRLATAMANEQNEKKRNANSPKANMQGSTEYNMQNKKWAKQDTLLNAGKKRSQ